MNIKHISLINTEYIRLAMNMKTLDYGKCTNLLTVYLKYIFYINVVSICFD